MSFLIFDILLFPIAWGISQVDMVQAKHRKGKKSNSDDAIGRKNDVTKI